MSGYRKSVLFLLRRCVAVRQVTVPPGIKTRGGVLSGCSEFIQRRTWASTTRTACPLLSAVRTGRYSFCTKAGEPCEEEYPSLPPYQPDSESEKKEVYIVQVKGLPWSCSAQDVLQFFSDCRIRDGVRGIHLTVDRQGRPMGQAFIEVEHEEDVSKALEKHRQYLGPRYVEVSEVTNRDAEVILKEAVQAPGNRNVVRIRGLPFSCSEADIEEFFSGLEIVDNGITFIEDRRGRNTGQAFVQFSSEEAADEALQRDREVIGNRYIEVFPSTISEVLSRTRTSAPPQRSLPSAHSKTDSQSSSRTMTNRDAEVILKEAVQAPGNRNVVRIRGLPFSCSEADIEEFFSGLEIVDNGITFIEDRRGRNTGQAFVQFSSEEAADEALQRDREVIGNRYIEVFPSTISEVLSRTRTSAPPQRSLPSAHSKTDSQSSSRTTFPQSSSLTLHYIRMRGLPFQTSGEDIVKFFSPLVVSKILIECCPDGRPSGEADVYFRSHRDATDAMSRDRLHIGGRYIELFLNSVPECNER